MKRILFEFSMVILVATGCSPSGRSFEDEIASHPRAWAMHCKWGASSNNYALLNRAASFKDPHEKIKYVTMVRDRLRYTPEEILSDRQGVYFYDQIQSFARGCADRLYRDKQQRPEVVMASWRMEADWADDHEKLIALTEKEWNGGVFISNEMTEKQNAAGYFRREYEMFFQLSFATCVTCSYHHMPVEYRPAFVKQIKKDFFNRKGMAYVKMEDQPAAFRE